MSKKNRGFASMDAEKHRAIARKGGLAVSQNKLHMSEIGRKGGERSGEVRGKTITTETGHKFKTFDLPESSMPSELRDAGFTNPKIFIPLGNPEDNALPQ